MIDYSDALIFRHFYTVLLESYVINWSFKILRHASLLIAVDARDAVTIYQSHRGN